ncbi:MAG TPA: polysaccharide biosynthesis/export family protein [Pseudolabrys sp.]|nr:polysaccharide biosynthesis/export family protein [Pseudolabrys sp.]
MRGPRFLFVVLAALTVAACMRHEPAYSVRDPRSGKVVSALPQRGLLGGRHDGAFASAKPPLQPPSILQYDSAAPAAHAVEQPSAVAALRTPEASAALAYGAAPASSHAPVPYTLDSGDKLRVVVFGQQGISNSYTVDANGNVTLPLVGTIPARGRTTQALAHTIADRLKAGYVREPNVSVEIETYRPFFILGEVTTPGQYSYVANITVEAAVAIAGGFTPRASKQTVELTRNGATQHIHQDVPLDFPIRPGDTIVVKERWF